MSVMSTRFDGTESVGDAPIVEPFIMISPTNIKKSQAKHILKLLERMARAEVLARIGRFDNLEFIDYAILKAKIEKELLEYVFGTSSLVELGYHWGILKKKKKRKRKRK